MTPKTSSRAQTLIFPGKKGQTHGIPQKAFPEEVTQDVQQNRIANAQEKHASNGQTRRNTALNVACNKPITGWKERGSGKLAFTPHDGTFGRDVEITVPCRQCRGCRLDQARDWSIRMYHEAQCHKENSFVTLTYNEAHLPPYGSIRYQDVQKFLKRLRKETGKKFLYYAAPEYGDSNGRPHYHLCMFGIDFSHDRYQWARRSGRQYYRSNTLERCWPFGFSDVSDFSYGAAQYVAKYVFKKRTGEEGNKRYSTTDPETGELIELEPEQARMSLKPAIGFTWFKRNYKEIFPTDNVAVNGTQKPVPEYYDRLWQSICPTGMEFVKRQRRKEASKRENTREVQDTRERFLNAQLARKKRNLNNEN